MATTRPNLIRAIAVITIAIEAIRVNAGTAAGVTAVVALDCEDGTLNCHVAMFGVWKII